MFSLILNHFWLAYSFMHHTWYCFDFFLFLGNNRSVWSSSRQHACAAWGSAIFSASHSSSSQPKGTMASSRIPTNWWLRVVLQVRLTQVDFKQPQPTRLKLLQELHQRYQPLSQVGHYFCWNNAQTLNFPAQRDLFVIMHSSNKCILFQSLPAKFLSGIVPNISAADLLSFDV